LKVLVAGGAGFLGSHLVDRLLTEGHRVTVVDNFVTGVRANLDHARSNQLRVIDADVEETPAGRYAEIYHLASPASPSAYERHALATIRANTEGTTRLAQVARATGARLLVASSSEVYGTPLEHPQTERTFGLVDPIGPRSQYAEAKRCAEALTVAYVRERQVDARIVRIFNTYGPRMRADDGRMPSTFIVAAIRGEAIPVHGDGTQTRSFCYVADLVEGLLAAMRRGVPGEAYNLGRPEEVSVLGFAELVIRLAHSMSTIALVPGRDQDIPRRRPDITKAWRHLRWRPSTTLRRGLSATIESYRAPSR
jgi:nucleoside-diphosphate-sugar epimerase